MANSSTEAAFRAFITCEARWRYSLASTVTMRSAWMTLLEIDCALLTGFACKKSPTPSDRCRLRIQPVDLTW